VNPRIVELLCEFSGMSPGEPSPALADLVGEVDPERLWRQLPAWRARRDAAEPDPKALAALRDGRAEITLTCVFGAWCHLSRESLPPLLKTVEAAGNERVRVRLIGLDDRFQEPHDAIRRLRLVNVPTLVVERAGVEVGRVVETPATESLEGDLVAILAERPRAHRGRWLRGPLLARGEYGHADAIGAIGVGGRRGSERFEIYALPGGGCLLHAEIETASGDLELWQRMDVRGRPGLLELTWRDGEEIARARHLIDGPRLTAWLRGHRTGEGADDDADGEGRQDRQRLTVPPHFALAPPSSSAAGWGWLQAEGAGRDRRRRRVLTYVTPPPAIGAAGTGGLGTLGRLAPASYRLAGEERVRTPAGEVAALRLEGAMDGRAFSCCLHPELLIPLRGRTFHGGGCELAHLELAHAELAAAGGSPWAP